MRFLTIVVLLFLLALLSLWARRTASQPASAVRGSGDLHGEQRAAISLLLALGLLLLVLAQILHAALEPVVPPALYLLLALGLGTFLLGGHAASTLNASWLGTVLPLRLRTYFSVSSPQLVLLLLAPAFAFMARLAAGNTLQATHAPVAAGAWVVAIAAAVFGSYRVQPAASLSHRRRILLLGLFLFLVAFLVRAVGVEHLPDTLSGDEGSAGLVAVAFRHGQADNLLGLGWFSFPSFYFAVQSSGIWLLGQTAAALRITSAFAGALTVVATFVLARLLFDRLIGALAALFLLGSHFHIHFSRIGLQNVWDGLFLMVILGALWHGWRSGRRASFVLFGLTLGLSAYFYVSTRVLPLLLLVWVGGAFLSEGERFRRRLPDLLLAAYVALVVALPLLLLFAAAPAEFNAPMQRVTIFNGWLEREVEERGEPAARIVLGEIERTLLGFTHEPLRHWYNPGTPLLLPAAAALFIAGVFWLFYLLDLRALLLLLPIAGMAIIGGLSQDAPASQRFVLVAPIVAILVALPLGQSARWLSGLWPARRRIFALLALVVMVTVVVGDLHYYFFEVYDSYTLGGPNTRTATAIGNYLRGESDTVETVYFFGPPRMSYRGFSTIPYLAPALEGHDVTAPLTTPPAWELSDPTLFIFLPERLAELEQVRARYPHGQIVRRGDPRNPHETLFTAYQVAP
ncbi:MAG: glycosyltransferase family 39 protein [Candidatus Promineifilaceae bacterium]|nr:glycosyltransferase family 39 protein [Candidatus Promineifilaceae bacterium]